MPSDNGGGFFDKVRHVAPDRIVRSALIGGVRSAVRRLSQNRWALRAIGILVFVLILRRVNLTETLRVLTAVDPVLLLLSFVVQGAALIVAAARWHIIMRILGIRAPFWRSFTYQLIGTAAAQVTPGELGEFAKVLYHRRDGHSAFESFLSVLVDRLYDLVVLLVFGTIAVVVLFSVPTVWVLGGGIGAGVLLIAGYLVPRRREGFLSWVSPVLVRLTPRAHRETVGSSARRLTEAMGRFSPGTLLLGGLVSVASYGLLLLRAYMLARAIHIDVGFWYFAMLMPLLRLAGLVPISISGIGTRDVAIIYLLGRAGVPQESSLALSVISLLSLQVQSLVGLGVWWRSPLRLAAVSRHHDPPPGTAAEGEHKRAVWRKTR